MQLRFENGKDIRGDALISSVLRYDLSPVPATLEAEIRTDGEESERLLSEGRVLEAWNGDRFYIVKSVLAANRQVQGSRETAGRRVTALLDNCKSIAFARQRAIIKENTMLSAVYRAAGAAIASIESDFAVARFSCLIGETPSFHIARALQEEGGVLCWKARRLKFFRLRDLFLQKPVKALPDNAMSHTESGFLERHETPSFFSLNPDASFVFGNRARPRTFSFTPFKDVLRLFNMSRCLVQKRIMNIDFDARLQAGDVVELSGGRRLAVITAVHVYETGTEMGKGETSYTRLWLGSVEE